MLVLVFNLGADKFAIEASRVIHVVPWVDLKAIYQSFAHIKGLLRLEGELIPVIDLCSLTTGKDCPFAFSSRIIIARIIDQEGKTRLVGVLAEKVTDTIEIDPDKLKSPGIKNKNAAYLGRILVPDESKGEEIQIVQVEHILSPKLKEALELELKEPEKSHVH